jgi:5,5'-dehydrodivanillate O-demethylase oxygenase subunit
MYSKEDNLRLTQTARGTPMGELLRRYWWPIGVSAHLRDKPTFVRLLGEDLVLYRLPSGAAAALGARCPHRGANLCLGHVDKRGLRCRYHGWLYDADGNVLETPGENSDLKSRVHQTSYPIEELGGLIFAYLGPQPQPLLPRYDFLAADEERQVRINGFAECNWLQCVENGMDPIHVSFLHSDLWSDLKEAPDEIEYEETDWGIVYKAFRPGPSATTRNYREHHCVLPGISIQQNGGRWSVPIDDTHTLLVMVKFFPKAETLDQYGKFEKDKSFAGRENRAEVYQSKGWDAIKVEPYKEYRERENQFKDVPELGYSFPGRDIALADATMLESLGPIVPREKENLGESTDRGIIMLRDLYLREIEAVKAGRDPKGTLRDAAKNKLIVLPTHERVDTRVAAPV